jgi:hypothetical protein
VEATPHGKQHTTVEVTYPDDRLGAHKLTLAGCGNDAVMAAAQLVAQNWNQGSPPPSILVWLTPGCAPSRTNAHGLVDLAWQLREEELDRLEPAF